MKNIFYVESPLQLFLMGSDIKSDDLLVIRPTTENCLIQLRKQVNHPSQNTLFIFPSSKLAKMVTFALIIIKILLSKGDIFIGDRNSLVGKAILKVRFFKRVVFYDDGVGTLLTLPKEKLRKNVSYKTIFSDKFKRSDVIKNELRHNEPVETEKETLWIVASKLIEADVLSVKDFEHIVEEIISYHFGWTINFIPHRDALETKCLVERLENIVVLEVNSAIESYVISQSELPEKIITIGTTAAFTLKAMLKTNVEFVPIAQFIKKSEICDRFLEIEKAYVMYDIKACTCL